MSKKLCDLKKLLKADLKEYTRHVDAPTHVCEKCGRVANSKLLLCKPVKIHKAK
jgi:hypothetical protein